ncbi:hypothetical protein [Legionella sp. CNM-4043-24]|uniref:hypothetical protein n=1 Tax=Legionella sp. CNM-4043-24 TaxID=3421646 RepID=UPI00403AB31F
MLLIHFFKKLAVLGFLLTITQAAVASIAERECGGTVFQVKINNLDFFSEYKLYYKINTTKWKIFYIPKAEHLSVACIKDKKNKELLLLEEICGGSFCSDDGFYTLFDPSTKKMLVKYRPLPSSKLYEDIDDDPGEVHAKVRRSDHEQDNHKKIAKVLGYAPPYLPDSKDTFCCNQIQN